MFSKSKTPSKTTNRSGVTLVEIMVSMFILGVGFTGLFSGFLHTRRLAQGSIYQNTASTIAYSYLEQLKSVEFSSLDDNPIIGLMSEGNDDSLNVSPTPTNFTTGNNATDVVNSFTIDINNTPSNEDDDMALRVFLYLDDITSEANGIGESRQIVIRYEADFIAAGYDQTFTNVIRSIRSETPTF
ncbi:prepilin-type N-terminal cleavage/methylation domain-containing protein [Puniceicoccaceae bacterium K14]|nr:prepilin-type N-terminal cleavage/methylation domain-containing protein [Puniceicoccaceae bacterium K14]